MNRMFIAGLSYGLTGNRDRGLHFVVVGNRRTFYEKCGPRNVPLSPGLVEVGKIIDHDGELVGTGFTVRNRNRKPRFPDDAINLFHEYAVDSWTVLSVSLELYIKLQLVRLCGFDNIGVLDLAIAWINVGLCRCRKLCSTDEKRENDNNFLHECFLLLQIAFGAIN